MEHPSKPELSLPVPYMPPEFFAKRWRSKEKKRRRLLKAEVEAKLFKKPMPRVREPELEPELLLLDDEEEKYELETLASIEDEEEEEEQEEEEQQE